MLNTFGILESINKKNFCYSRINQKKKNVILESIKKITFGILDRQRLGVSTDLAKDRAQMKKKIHTGDITG